MMRPGRVVHAVESSGGGTLHVVQAYANATAALGIPTAVVFGRRRETPSVRDLRDLFAANVELIEVAGWGNRAPVSAIVSGRRAADVLRAQFRESDSGLLHLHSSYAGVVGRLLRPPPRWRMLYSPHAYGFLRGRSSVSSFSIGCIERLLAPRALTVAVSETEASVARQLRRGASVVVVPNGVNPVKQDAPGPRNVALPPSVCIVGRADSQRAPELLCEAMTELDGLRVTWVGDGPSRVHLEAAGVTVTGWLERASARRLLSESTVVLHLAHYDGLSLALLEAMMAGKAIVALDGPAAREVLADTALYVRNAGELARRLRSLCADPSELGRLGVAARARALRSFSERQMIDSLFAVYNVHSTAA